MEEPAESAVLKATIMPTRFLIGGLHFFGIAATVAIGVALLAPIDAVRFLGVLALTCAGTGFLVHLCALQRLDPHAFMVFSSRFREAPHTARAIASRVAGILTGAADSASSRSVR
jgi:hypothetical protein